MRLGRVLMTFGVAAILAGGGLLTPWALAEMPGSDMAGMVGSAKTAPDHEALAAQYDKDAAEAKANAEMHRKMGAAYKGQPAVTGGKAVGASAMPQHCDSLAKSFDEQAAMYEKMAATERELAKSAK
jgi:hypothetical protein